MSNYIVGVIRHPEQDIKDLLWKYSKDNCYEFLDYTEWAKNNLVIPEAASLDFQDYLDYIVTKSDYAGYLVKNGDKIGRMHNPNAMWDWCEIGGFWDGALKLKPGCVGKRGNGRVFGHAKEHEDWSNLYERIYFGDIGGRPEEYMDEKTHCSEARIGDIDFSPNRKFYTKALRFWETYIDGEPLRDGDIKLDNAHIYFCREHYIDEYDDKYDFAERRSLFTTYAIITPDGIWHDNKTELAKYQHEKPNQSINIKTEWERHYKEFIENADPDDIFTIIECHL